MLKTLSVVSVAVLLVVFSLLVGAYTGVHMRPILPVVMCSPVDHTAYVERYRGFGMVLAEKDANLRDLCSALNYRDRN
jgi:hypothetical protein